MTEDEAKTKWCPMVSTKIIQENVHGENRINHLAEESRTAYKCIASDCMMWAEQHDFNEETQEFYVNGGHCGLSK